MTDVVFVEQRGPARILTLNRPESLNAMAEGLPQRLLDELAAADADPDARVVILTGAGGGVLRRRRREGNVPLSRAGRGRAAGARCRRAPCFGRARSPRRSAR